jgi:hypothetical protein
MPKQIMGNAIGLLMQLLLFLLKEFDTWEAMPMKSYPILKMFIHKAYSRRLTSIQLHNTAGQQGYVQENMYNISNKEEDDDTDNNATMITQMAVAATTGSRLGARTQPPQL